MTAHTPFGLRNELTTSNAPSVVDKDVEPPEPFVDTGYCGTDLIRLRDIAGDPDGIAPEAPDSRSSRVASKGFDIQDRHVGTEAGQAQGAALTYPAPSAGHNGHLVCEKDVGRVQSRVLDVSRDPHHLDVVHTSPP
jgi:hypothetical protein